MIEEKRERVSKYLKGGRERERERKCKCFRNIPNFRQEARNSRERQRATLPKNSQKGEAEKKSDVQAAQIFWSGQHG